MIIELKKYLQYVISALVSGFLLNLIYSLVIIYLFDQWSQNPSPADAMETRIIIFSIFHPISVGVSLSAIHRLKIKQADWKLGIVFGFLSLLSMEVCVRLADNQYLDKLTTSLVWLILPAILIYPVSLIRSEVLWQYCRNKQ